MGSICYLYCHRLYSKGRVLGHKRAKRNSRPNTSLIQIEGVGKKEDVQFYLGKVREFRTGFSTVIKTCVLSVLHTSTKPSGKSRVPKFV